MFFMFFKLYKQYQITQCILYKKLTDILYLYLNVATMNLLFDISSVIRQKSEYQDGGNKKTKLASVLRFAFYPYYRQFDTFSERFQHILKETFFFFLKYSKFIKLISKMQRLQIKEIKKMDKKDKMKTRYQNQYITRQICCIHQNLDISPCIHFRAATTVAFFMQQQGCSSSTLTRLSS